MQTDAIQQDVSTQDEVNDGAATGSETILSPREQAMLEISQQLLEQQQAQGYALPKEEVAPAVVIPQGEQKVTVKVDGVEVEMLLSEVTKGYQKDAVASRRLAAAAEERKKLETWEHELKSREAALISGGTSSTEDIDGLIDAYNDAMVEGDTAEQKRIFKLMNSGRQQTTQPVIDEEAIIAKAEARIENRQAWTDFVGTNPAFADSDSKQRQYGDYLFDQVYSPLIASGELSYREALMKTSEEVGKIFTPQQSPRQQKEERKRGIDNIPVAAGARAVSTQNLPKSTNDVISDMMRARGQLV